MGVQISSSLGAMRPLVAKLSMLLRGDAPQECSSKRVKDRIRLLKDDIKKISSYLDDLSEVEDPPPTAICWMNEARDLSYDMEDYIDSLLFVRPEHPSVVPNNIKTTRLLRKLSSCAKTPKTRVNIAESLSEFRMHVQEAIERHQRYNLHSCRTLKRRFVSLGPMPLPTPYEETANIVIDDRMAGFINSLANDGDQQLKVLPVLGSACMGKTTLARVLYNRFGKQYHYRAFVRVSKKPNMKRIFCDILSQLRRQQPPQHYKETDLIQNIRQYLQDKKYLIIIDDVWAASVWDIINHAFPMGNNGSRIITTTQIEDVALTCCCFQSEYVFEMKLLDDDHSRKLFFNRLCGSQSDCPEQFKEVLNEIVDICDGLPLATIVVASLLASQPTMSIDLLKYIQQSLSSCLSASERTRQALNLSFNILPSYLKTCLLYLFMYPEGYTFCNDDLVKQWLAEGFIDITEGQDMVKVAESYLDQLIARRFIQPICINYNNEVLSCAVHDAVHDLLAHKSAEENFVVAINYSQHNAACSHKARRLSILFGDTRYAKAPANITMSQVRSLRFFGSLKTMPCIREFKLLRVLNLQLSDHPGIDNLRHLTAISELFQLRYLKIACDVYIQLPNHGLECLETLDITDANFFSWNIHPPHLLHLSLPLEKLVDGIGGTQSLIRQTAGRLNCLQELHLTPDVYSLEKHMEALGFLIEGHGNLKTIVVARGSSVFKSIVFPAVSEVTISWDGLAPPRHLQRFEFLPHSGILFSRIPVWVKELNNLRILKIAVREIYCLETLRGLPALTALSLYLETAPRHMIIFDTAAEFSVLKYFKLRCTSGIAWLKFKAGAMPNLWKLKLVFNAIQPVDQDLLYSSYQDTSNQHQHGTAVISLEHMPDLKEISVKVGCAAADREYALRYFSNHPSNPTINMRLVDRTSYGDESTKQKHQLDEILAVEPSGSNKQQPKEILEKEPDSESTKQKQQPDEILEEEPTGSNKQQPEEILQKEPDNYDKLFSYGTESIEQKQQPDEILAEEPSGSNKQQPEEILEKEPDNYEKIFERPRSSPLEKKEDKFSRLQFSGMSLKKVLRNSGRGQEKKPIHHRNDGGTISEMQKRLPVSRIGVSNHPSNPTITMQFVLQIGQWGGLGGGFCDIEEEPRRLRSLTIGSGETIYSLGFSYDDHDGKKHTVGPWGGYGPKGHGICDRINLAPLEVITEVRGTTGRVDYEGIVIHCVVKSLTIITNCGRYGPFGDVTGTRFQIPVQSNGSIVGFFAQTGWCLDALGVYVRPNHETEGSGHAKIGPWGGTRGQLHDIDVAPKRLESVTVSCGTVIDSLAFSYRDHDGQHQTSGPWGGLGESSHTIQFGHLEFLTGFHGTTGPLTPASADHVVTSLTLVTNVCSYGPFGEGGGEPFQVPMCKGSIVGFFGRAESYVNAIGVYANPFQEATKEKDILSWTGLREEYWKGLGESQPEWTT